MSQKPIVVAVIRCILCLSAACSVVKEVSADHRDPNSRDGQTHSFFNARLAAVTDNAYRPIVIYRAIQQYRSLDRDKKSPETLGKIYDFYWLKFNADSQYDKSDLQGGLDRREEAVWNVMKSVPLPGLLPMVEPTIDLAVEQHRVLLNTAFPGLKDLRAAEQRANSRAALALVRGRDASQNKLLRWYEIHQAAKSDPNVGEFLKAIYITEANTFGFDPSQPIERICESRPLLKECFEKRPALRRLTLTVARGDKVETESEAATAKDLDEAKEELKALVVEELQAAVRTFKEHAAQDSKVQRTQIEQQEARAKAAENLKQAEAAVMLFDLAVSKMSPGPVQRRAAQCSTIAKGALQIAATTMGESGGLVLVNGYVGAAVMIYNALEDPEPSIESVILGEIQALHQAVYETRMEMRKEFGRLDDKLDAVHESLSAQYRDLRRVILKDTFEIKESLATLRSDVLDLQDKLDQLSFDVAILRTEVKTYFQEDLYRRYISEFERYLATKKLDPTSFKDGLSAFKVRAVDFAKQKSVTGVTGNESFSNAEAASVLRAGISVRRHIYLTELARARFGKVAHLINPAVGPIDVGEIEEWMQGTEMYIQLWKRYPQYVLDGHASPEQVEHLIHRGRGIRESLRGLYTKKVPGVDVRVVDDEFDALLHKNYYDCMKTLCQVVIECAEARKAAVEALDAHQMLGDPSMDIVQIDDLGSTLKLVIPRPDEDLPEIRLKVSQHGHHVGHGLAKRFKGAATGVFRSEIDADLNRLARVGIKRLTLRLKWHDVEVNRHVFELEGVQKRYRRGLPVLEVSGILCLRDPQNDEEREWASFFTAKYKGRVKLPMSGPLLGDPPGELVVGVGRSENFEERMLQDRKKGLNDFGKSMVSSMAQDWERIPPGEVADVILNLPKTDTDRVRRVVAAVEARADLELASAFGGQGDPVGGYLILNPTLRSRLNEALAGIDGSAKIAASMFALCHPYIIAQNEPLQVAFDNLWTRQSIAKTLGSLESWHKFSRAGDYNALSRGIGEVANRHVDDLVTQKTKILFDAGEQPEIDALLCELVRLREEAMSSQNGEEK
jgi:hypothetical protein